MSETIKPCPFCDKIPSSYIVGFCGCTNSDCWLSRHSALPNNAWNHRPIEDKLQAQIKSLSEQLEKAEECLRFYADKNKYSFSTDIDDFIEWYGGDEDNYKIAGYKAREYFKQKGEQK